MGHMQVHRFHWLCYPCWPLSPTLYFFSGQNAITAQVLHTKKICCTIFWLLCSRSYSDVRLHIFLHIVVAMCSKLVPSYLLSNNEHHAFKHSINTCYMQVYRFPRLCYSCSPLSPTLYFFQGQNSITVQVLCTKNICCTIFFITAQPIVQQCHTAHFFTHHCGNVLTNSP